MANKDIYSYPGKEIDVSWDERLCIHIGECGRASGELFIGGRQPWCQPDLASSLEEVTDVVESCPTGALSYQSKDGNTKEAAVEENTVFVSYNGPLFVRGDLHIEAAPEDMPGVGFRAALCRCGQSKTKPFCDNSHARENFQDYGAVGEKGAPLQVRGGKLNIRPRKDGPLLLTGNVTIRAGSGRVAWEGVNVVLCCCGASENKPFCDGSHKKVGFKN